MSMYFDDNDDQYVCAYGSYCSLDEDTSYDESDELDESDMPDDFGSYSAMENELGDSAESFFDNIVALITSAMPSSVLALGLPMETIRANLKNRYAATNLLLDVKGKVSICDAVTGYDVLGIVGNYVESFLAINPYNRDCPEFAATVHYGVSLIETVLNYSLPAVGAEAIPDIAAAVFFGDKDAVKKVMILISADLVDAPHEEVKYILPRISRVENFLMVLCASVGRLLAVIDGQDHLYDAVDLKNQLIDLAYQELLPDSQA
jgi:hypothetical protein